VSTVRRRPPLEPHPAAAVLRLRRISNVAVARALNCSPGWVGATLLRQVPASARFREGLAAMLGLSEPELFYDEPPSPRYPGDVIFLDIDDDAYPDDTLASGATGGSE
jgi:hypothetical protein